MQWIRTGDYLDAARIKKSLGAFGMDAKISFLNLHACGSRPLTCSDRPSHATNTSTHPRQLIWLDGKTLGNIDNASFLVYLKCLMQTPCAFCILPIAGGLIDLMAASDVKVRRADLGFQESIIN